MVAFPNQIDYILLDIERRLVHRWWSMGMNPKTRKDHKWGVPQVIWNDVDEFDVTLDVFNLAAMAR